MSTTLLYGKNQFGIDFEKKARVKDFYGKHGAEGVVVLEGSEIEWQNLVQELDGVSLFAAKNKLVVVNEASENKELADELANWTEQKSSSDDGSTLLLLVDPKIDKRSVLFKTLKKHAELVESPNLDENDLAKWVVKHAEKLGGKIALADARHLVNIVGDDQLRLSNEIDKLVQFDVEVTKASISKMIEPKLQDSIFKLLDAVLAGKQKEAIEIYRNLRKDKVQPIYIMTMLGWQLHNVLVVKLGNERTDAQIAKDHKMSPYVVGKTRNLIRHISLTRLQEMFDEATETDLKLKSSKSDNDLIMENLISKLTIS